MDLTIEGRRVRRSLEVEEEDLARTIFWREKRRLVRDLKGIEALDAVVDGLTTEEFLERYEAAAFTRMTERHWRDSKQRVESFFKFAGVARITQIRPDHVSDWQLDRLKNGRTRSGNPLSRTTVMHDIKALRAAMRWARKKRYLETDPTEPVDRITPDYRKRRIDFLTDAEARDLLRLAREPVPFHGPGQKGKGRSRQRVTPIERVIAVAIYAGLRLSEILWLDWEDIDFDRKVLLVRAKDGWKPKTREDREVPLFPPLAAILEPVRLHCGPCFQTRGGKRYHRRNMHRELARIAARLGERPRNVTFLTLRHTFATRLVSKGVPIYAVSRWLGHRSIRTTERHYAGFAPNPALFDQAAAAMAG